MLQESFQSAAEGGTAVLVRSSSGGGLVALWWLLLSPASPASFFTFRNLRPPKNMRKSRGKEGGAKGGGSGGEKDGEGREEWSVGWVDGISKDYHAVLLSFLSPRLVSREVQNVGKGRGRE